MSQNSPIGSPRAFCINVLFNSDHQPRMLTRLRGRDFCLDNAHITDKPEVNVN
jgi:hypothetical protein